MGYGIGWVHRVEGSSAVAGLFSGDIELKYTLLADANLNGAVNGSDFSLLAANFGLGVTNWDQDNSLYGGSVNGFDFSALAANFGQGDSGAMSTYLKPTSRHWIRLPSPTACLFQRLGQYPSRASARCS